MCHYQIICQKIQKTCLRGIEEFTNLCARTNARKVDNASGIPSPSSAIYNFVHSVRGWAIGT